MSKPRNPFKITIAPVDEEQALLLELARLEKAERLADLKLKIAEAKKRTAEKNARVLELERPTAPGFEKPKQPRGASEGGPEQDERELTRDEEERKESRPTALVLSDQKITPSGTTKEKITFNANGVILSEGNIPAIAKVLAKEAARLNAFQLQVGLYCETSKNSHETVAGTLTLEYITDKLFKTLRDIKAGGSPDLFEVTRVTFSRRAAKASD